MIEDDVLKFYLRGIWPGPGETKDDFLKRARAQMSCAQVNDVPNIQQRCDQRTFDLFHFTQPFMPVLFSNKGLMAWEGAAFYVEEHSGIDIAHVQLRKSFLKGSFLFYKTEEVLCHEAFHAARLTYSAPRYEELFAYKTSKSSFRRFLGPIFQSPLEAKVFVVVCFFSLLMQMLFGVAIGSIPFLTAVVFFIARLYLRHMRLARALKYIEPLLKRKEDALAAVCRLTDEEIDSFARLGSPYIEKYFASNRYNELRLTLLCDSLLNRCF